MSKSVEKRLCKQAWIESYAFIEESNKIEGITRPPTVEEIQEHERFISLDVITIPELERFVEVYQPGAKLRNRVGMNVRVGSYTPLPGGIHIGEVLKKVLIKMNQPWVSSSPYNIHRDYETLHPFTDCNGRSGRALWLWHMRKKGLDTSLGFLHTFYYQALSEGR